MIPRDKPCKYCGKRIFFAATERGKIPLDAGFTPFKRVPGGNVYGLYTNDGTRIPCVILSEAQSGEAEGYAHIVHICPQKPTTRRTQPLTRRQLLEESGLYD